ncbi:hypothetical protein DFH06DRAFT_1338418 [Mycena polygramma]|nr:hypothetical protein DFH06DRAFT_1338418 [Mycena polygramma]
MLKGIVKWRRKRPREPGRAGIPQEPPRSLQTHRFTLFKKQIGERVSEVHDLSQVPYTTIEPKQTRLSALDVATPASKVLLYVCEAPPLGFLKPLAGLANHACEMFQAVRSYKEAAERLEKQATQVEFVIEDLVEPMPPHSMEILQILEEIRCFLNAADLVTTKSPRRKRLSLWLIAAREQDRARALSERLRDAVSVLQTANTLNLTNSLRRIESRQVAEQAQNNRHNTDQMVPSSQLGKETSRQFAFFVYRAGVSWSPSRGAYVFYVEPSGLPLKLGECSAHTRI